MLKIRIDYTKVAEKFFIKHEDVRNDFKRNIVKIITGNHPEQVNFKNLKGELKGYSRIAIDNYRVIYKKTEDIIVIVSVILAGTRGDVYKHIH